MKAIIHARSDGGVSVVYPAEGARLCSAYAVSQQFGGDGSKTTVDPPLPIEQVFRRWPVKGVTPTWAETEDEFIARVAKRSLPPGAAFTVVDASALPADRTFRDAWAIKGKGLTIDMARAREIHKTRLREARAPLLAALDIEYQRADEAGDAPAKKAISAKKTALRDVTDNPGLAAAKTPDELKALWPAALSAK